MDVSGVALLLGYDATRTPTSRATSSFVTVELLFFALKHRDALALELEWGRGMARAVPLRRSSSTQPASPRRVPVGLSDGVADRPVPQALELRSDVDSASGSGPHRLQDGLRARRLPCW